MIHFEFRQKYVLKTLKVFTIGSVFFHFPGYKISMFWSLRGQHFYTSHHKATFKSILMSRKVFNFFKYRHAGKTFLLNPRTWCAEGAIKWPNVQESIFEFPPYCPPDFVNLWFLDLIVLLCKHILSCQNTSYFTTLDVYKMQILWRRFSFILS